MLTMTTATMKTQAHIKYHNILYAEYSYIFRTETKNEKQNDKEKCCTVMCDNKQPWHRIR